jgi:uncharacterized damage-inducible protein DinB
VNRLNTRWLELKAEQGAFVEAVTSERLHAVLTYVNLQGQTWRYALWRQMYHVVNHSTYHRGQLTTMLRQLGTVPVPTDFLVFHDELDSGLPDATSQGEARWKRKACSLKSTPRRRKRSLADC